MTRLVLFCGGPAIYPGGVPKPLQVLDNGRTLLELYLKSPFAADYPDVVLLCESEFLNAFRAVVERGKGDVKATVVETPNGSSTLQKLTTYLDSFPRGEHLEVWTYPDIFYFGRLIPQKQTDWFKRVVLSVRAMSSRFPRIVMDPYTHQVRSITTHQGAVPANPAHLFGGHLVASPHLLSRVLSHVTELAIEEPVSLEVDVFSWMISRSMVDALPLEDPWFQADGPRELRDIMGRVTF